MKKGWSRRFEDPIVLPDGRNLLTLYVSHYNLCRVHEALRTTPAVALGIVDRVWTIGDLIDAVLPLEPNRPARVKRNFTVIDGGKK